MVNIWMQTNIRLYHPFFFKFIHSNNTNNTHIYFSNHMSLFSPAKGEGILFWRCLSFRPSVLPSVRHFCVRSHILEVLWWISLKLGMSIYMDKRMMHTKWHCTPSVNNGVMALCIYSVSMQHVGVYVTSVTKL